MQKDFEGKRQALKDQLQRVLGGIEVLDRLEKEQEDYNKEKDKKWLHIVVPNKSLPIHLNP